MTIGDLIAQFLPKLISAIFNFFMIILITAIQAITWPINQVIINFFPSLAEQITKLTDNLANLLTFLPYTLTYLPTGIEALILFILGTEITLLYLFRSSYLVAKVWKIVQTVKFW